MCPSPGCRPHPHHNNVTKIVAATIAIVQAMSLPGQKTLD